MTIWEYIIGAIIIVFALIIIAVVLLQEGRQANLGAISGAAENFMDKGRARTLDAFLAKWTKVLAIVFFVLVFLGMLVTKFLGAK
ncbi:MAG: preprotein translocase subunit SecG [Clostridia bacterium]|nr:preprotein translocase subunit SecG [Clostridia bacterium]